MVDGRGYESPVEDVAIRGGGRHERHDPAGGGDGEALVDDVVHERAPVGVGGERAVRLSPRSAPSGFNAAL